MNVDADLRRLRMFLAVADTQHVGRAAQQLRVAQPSVSQQVARLERQLGCRLFERTPQGVILTSAGRALAQQIGPRVRALDRAWATFVAHESSDTLRVGALSSLAASLIPSAVADVSPDATVGEFRVTVTEGSLAQLLQRLTEGTFHVVFCYSTTDPTALQGYTVHLLDERAIQVAVPADDPLAAGGKVLWADAATRPWIMPSASRQYYEDMLERFTGRGLDIHVVAEASTLSGQLGLVAANIGWTFTSPWTPIPPGVRRIELVDADRIQLLAATRAISTNHARALIDAVASRATLFNS